MASVVWMTPLDPGPRVKGERIRLDTILDGKFKPNPFNASWVKGMLFQQYKRKICEQRKKFETLSNNLNSLMENEHSLKRKITAARAFNPNK